MKQVLMAIDNDVANAPRGLPPGVLGIWLRDGARTAFMLRPRSRELNAEPALLALLLVIVLLLRVSWPRRALGGFVIAVACVPLALNLWLQPAWYWYPRAEPQSASTTQRFHLTQEVMERQPAVLASALQRLAPQRAGVVD